MQRITDTIHLIPEEHLNQAMPDCNVYVIGTHNEFYLIDTGNGLTANNKINTLRDNGFPLTSCRGIICTHSHLDHTNGAAAFDKPVHMHEADAHALEHDSAGAIYALPQFHTLAVRAGLTLNHFSVAHTLKDGDNITLATTVWRVIHTPGHTPGSICLHHDGILISGDTLFADTIGRTDFAGSNSAQMKHSLQRINALHAHTLLPGHAGILTNNPDKITETIQHWTRQLNT